jgi:hypothetical protein
MIQSTPGSYLVVVKSFASGCLSKIDTAIVYNQPEIPTQPTVLITQPTCFIATGSITITAQHADETYSFDEGVTFQTSNIKSQLSTGSYKVLIKSYASGCLSNVDTATVNSQPKTPPQPTIDLTVLSSQQYKLTASQSSAYQWYKDGNPIVGATSSTFITSEFGSYVVVVFSSDGCASDLSSAQTIVITGDLMAPSHVQFYPDPVKDYFYVEGVSNVTNGVVMSLDGREMGIQYYNLDGKIEFDLRGVVSGMYVAKIIDGNNLLIIKFIKL